MVQGFWESVERKNDAWLRRGRLTTRGIAEGGVIFHSLKLSYQKDLFLTWWTAVNCKAVLSTPIDTEYLSLDPPEMCAMQRTLPLLSEPEDLGI